MGNRHNRIRVLFIWPATEELQSYFHRELDEITDISFCESREENDIVEMAKEADILVGWAVRETILKAASRARLVVIPAIGVERHIPILRKFPQLQAANSRGNAVPTAQHTVALLLAATNHVLYFDQHMRSGKWRAYQDTPTSLLLENVPVGILGCGSVGLEIIKRLKGFGCRISGCSRSGRQLENYPDITVFPFGELENFLQAIRILIVAVPLTPETKDMIGSREINLLQDNAILVNIARGPIVNEDALYEGLKNKKLQSAAIDVWYNYRPEPVDHKKYPYSHKFHELPNVILSPHRASSPLTRPGRYVDVVDNIKRFINGKPLTNLIDFKKGY